MTTIKEYGCGGHYSFLQFFPCRLCISRNNPSSCAQILKCKRTTKHKEYFSDLSGQMWNQIPVTYYAHNPITKEWNEISKDTYLTLQNNRGDLIAKETIPSRDD